MIKHVTRRIRTMRPPGIRVQLTLWYGSIFATLLIIFGLAFYLVMRASLLSYVDSQLLTRTQQVATGISFANDTVTIQDTTGELPGLGQQSQSEATSTTDQGSTANQQTTTPDVNFGTLVRILNAQHKDVYVSPAFRNLIVPPASVNTAFKNQTWIATIHAHDGQSIELVSMPITSNGKVVGVVQVGQTLEPYLDTLTHILIGLLILIPVVLIIAGVGSYWLAGKAFQPIRHLTSMAQEINASDLRRRVVVPPAKDDIRDLAFTLNGMIARLEQSFEQQHRFVADASHELRTPVAAMLTMTESALESESSAEMTTTLQDMNGELQRLGLLISDLLALARSDAGQLILDNEPLRLDLLVEDVTESLITLAEDRQVHLKTQTYPVTINGDAGRIIQMLIALTDNAIRYTPAQGSITLSVEENAAEAQITIQDTGIGIGPEDIPHIFERFFRADPARQRAHGGSGLGLAIVQEIIKASGGSIDIESALEQGTTFTITLPKDRKASHRIERCMM